MFFAYKFFLLLLLYMPKPVENLLFAVLYPAYKATHQKRAWGRVQRHLQNTRMDARTCPRKVFHSLYTNYLQSLRYLCRLPSAIQKVHFENEEIIRRPLKDDTPLVALGIHQGAFEMMHRVLTRYSNHVYLFTHSFKDKALTRLLHRIRGTQGLEERETSSVAHTLREFLKNRGILAMLIDQAEDSRGLPVQILGQPAELFLRLPLKAMELGAGIVTFRTFFENGKHIVRFENYYLPRSPAAEVTGKIAEEVSLWISEHPEQWTWNYHRNFSIGLAK
ncbi:lysophospholipid acyltransferase family protein [Fibrobacter intestinalis]|uniref:lysophospholipid acyltransferase family protein n=1 Tax=Fibrobacter intestinalis TaxID=28122 RepID=UPI0030B80960